MLGDGAEILTGYCNFHKSCPNVLPGNAVIAMQSSFSVGRLHFLKYALNDI
jgi:hypothetical protein